MRKLFYLLIVLFLSCAPDAEHKNPHDPFNPDATGEIKGEVISLFGSIPLQGSIIHLFPTESEDTTDQTGTFQFTNLIPGIYIITAETDMYVDKAETLQVDGGEEKEIQFKLNGKPDIVDYSICSVHSISTFEKYEAIFTLKFFDPDAFIADSVVAESEHEKFLLLFENGDTIGTYKKRKPYANKIMIDTLTGIPFHFWVKDLGGSYSDTLTTVLVRVIFESAEITFPLPGDTITNGDTLLWTPPIITFNSFILIKIWERGGTPENPDWISDTLSVTDSLLVFTGSLEDGEYEMAVEVQDNFGNISRTIEWFYFE